MVQCEGVNRNTVYAIMVNSDGHYIVYKFEPAYKVEANLSVNSGLSENKIAPNYAIDMQGAPSTEYLYPQHLLPEGKSPIVRIKMTGKRYGIDGDFAAANAAIGRADLKDKMINVDYTWHHLDDFEIINGEPYCTMQLVFIRAHTRLQGLGHSASVAQFKAYYGNAAKAPGGFFYTR